MSNLKRVRWLCAGALLGVSSIAALAQQAPAPPAEKPPTAKPAPAPNQPQQKPPAPPKSAQGQAGSLVGLTAFSSDGNKVGDVRAVKTAPDGKTTLHVRTGGFLGFGGRTVAIPEGRYTRSGQNIQLSLTADEVSKLPAVKDAS